MTRCAILFCILMVGLLVACAQEPEPVEQVQILEPVEEMEISTPVEGVEVATPAEKAEKVAKTKKAEKIEKPTSALKSVPMSTSTLVSTTVLTSVPTSVPVARAASIGAPQMLVLPAAERVLFTDAFTDYAVDGDQDGLFETLVVDVEVAVAEANHYNFGASLYVVDAGGAVQGIDGVQRWLFLEEGIQMVSMAFEGKYIKLSEQSGSYQLSDLWVTHIQNPTPMQLRENVIDSREAPYRTAEYVHTQFQGP